MSKLKRFVETTDVQNRDIQRVEASTKLHENISRTAAIGQFNEAVQQAYANGEFSIYKFPVSRFDHINFNGRDYNRPLWVNVIENQRDAWQGRTGLGDHPSDDEEGMFKNSAVLWLDMEIDDPNKLIWGTCVFVGPLGDLAKDIVDKGGRIGFSSSGFGELMSDGKTVNPDTFEIERVADIVLNPSQGVFGEKQDELTVEYGKQVRESVNNNNNTNYTRGTNLEEEKETIVAKPVSKLEERKFRKDIQSFLEDVAKITSPTARLKEMQDIITYFEEGVALDLKEEVEAKIAETETEVNELIEEGYKSKQTFGVGVDELTEGVALLGEEIKVVKEDAKDWQKIALVMRENVNTLRDEVVKGNDSISGYKEAVAQKEAKVTSALKKLALAEKHIERAQMAAVLENADLSKSLNTANTKLSEAKKLNRKNSLANATVNDVLKENKILKNKLALNKAALDESRKKKPMAEKKPSKATAMKVKTVMAENTALLADNDSLNSKNANLNEANVKLQKQLKEATALIPRKIETRPKDNLSNFVDFRENGGAGVEGYWNDLVQRHGEAIKIHENKIRGAKTYKEASAAYIRALPTLDGRTVAVQRATLPESTSISRAERKQMLEKSGMNFGKGETKLPKGWK